MVVKQVFIVCPTRRGYRDLPAIARALNYQPAFERVAGAINIYPPPLVQSACVLSVFHRNSDQAASTSMPDPPHMCVAARTAPGT